MLFRFTALAVLGASLFAPRATGQTVAEQLQKAIYAQETEGKLDEAIALYRQILGSAQAERTVSAMAQFRLAQALLQKGDLDGAAREFQKLATQYPDQGQLFANLASRFRRINQMPGPALGTLQNGRYRHNLTGVEITIPQGMAFFGDFESSGGGEMAVFGEQGSPANTSIAVWLKPQEPSAPAELESLLRRDMAQKPTQRTDLDGWKIRPESIQAIGGLGHQGYSGVADYVEGGKKMVECLTWMRTTKNKVFFFSRGPASELYHLQTRMQQLLITAMIP